MFWARMATRVVPLATGPGRPSRTITGMTMSDPPPAMTLRNPAATPTTVAAGMATGGWIGSHVAVKKGERMIRVVVYITLTALAVKLVLG